MVIKKLFSIGMPVYNDAKYLKYTLESIRIQEYPKEKYEILILDSSDIIEETKKVITKFNDLPIEYSHIKKTKPFDVGYKHNIGLRKAKGEYYIITGSDLIHITPTLFQLENEFTLFPEAFLGGIAFNLEKEWEENNPNWKEKPRLLLSNKSIANTDLVPNGSFMSVRTEVIKLIGGYDQTFSHYGFEDRDLVFRLVLFQLLKGKPTYRIDALLGHLKPISRRLNLDNSVYYIGKVLPYIVRNYTFKLLIDKKKRAIKVFIVKHPFFKDLEFVHGIVHTGFGSFDGRQRWILSQCGLHESILHVGSSDNKIFKGTDLEKKVIPMDLDTYDIPNFIQLDAHDLISEEKSKLKDKQFDVVVLAEILEHVRDPVLVLKGAKRVGKRILITVPNPAKWDKDLKPYQTLSELLEEKKKMTLEEMVKEDNPGVIKFYSKDNHAHLFHQRWYTQEMLETHLKNAGLEQYSLQELEYDGWAFYVVIAYA